MMRLSLKINVCGAVIVHRFLDQNSESLKQMKTVFLFTPF